MTAQKMGKDILTSAGYDVTTVSNGAAAAKKLVDKHDIYILDIFMPGYSGFELCEKVRASADSARVPVLLTVGKMEPFSQAEVQRVRADGIIIKPFEASDLLTAIKKLAAVQSAPPVEKVEIFTPPPVEEFPEPEHMPVPVPPPAAVPQEMASSPIFMVHEPEEVADMPPAQEVAPIRSVSPTDETVEFLAPVAAVETTSAPAADFGMEFPAVPPTEASTPIETAPAESSISIPPIEAAPTVEPQPEAHAVEFNSAPKAGSVQVEQESALEAEEKSSEESVISQDPSLVTDPTEIASEFVTKFGVETAEIGEVEKGFADLPSESSEVAVDAPAELDDFEARVAAALAGFGDEPATATAEPAPAEDVPTVAPVEAAAQSGPGMDDTQEMEAVAEEIPESRRPPEGMQDAAMVEQMQAAFAKLQGPPIEEPAPVNTASEPEAPNTTITETPGQELAAESAAAEPPIPEVPAAAAAAAGASGMDTQMTATVVNRVLERMLPAIMVEVAKELEAAKKQ
jgi:CheY-like chemotaxis protein